jgi:Cysteine-rich secretory protein family
MVRQFGCECPRLGKLLGYNRELQEPDTDAGVNLVEATAGALSVTQLVGIWGNEQQYFVDGTFPDVSTTGNWEDVGHYSQMVWRNTTEVGGGPATGQASISWCATIIPPEM